MTKKAAKKKATRKRKTRDYGFPSYDQFQLESRLSDLERQMETLMNFKVVDLARIVRAL